MAFTFGPKSLAELQGVHADLVSCVYRALETTSIDFAVHDGIRSAAQQREYVRTGVSQTMESRHLTGHAVDLVPYINGKLRWEWEPIYAIADAMMYAGRDLSIKLRWGGAWDTLLTAVDRDELTSRTKSAAYAARCRHVNRRVFLDGPHFELPKEDYP